LQIVWWRFNPFAGAAAKVCQLQHAGFGAHGITGFDVLVRDSSLMQLRKRGGCIFHGPKAVAC
jgi:hypothetical protein